MNSLQLYLDEDSADGDLVTALRATGFSVVTVVEAGLAGIFRRGTPRLRNEDWSRAIYSANLCDFFRIHSEWMRAGREHAGLILLQQQRYSVGEQLRRILRVSAAFSQPELRNRIEFLSGWE